MRRSFTYLCYRNISNYFKLLKAFLGFRRLILHLGSAKTVACKHVFNLNDMFSAKDKTVS